MLTSSLFLYYDALKSGDLQKLSDIMTTESYLLTLEALGFKRAFKDRSFKGLLKEIPDDEVSLKKVNNILSADLAEESREYQIEITAFDSKGPERITLYYRENGHPKRLYFSSSSREWKIDYKAGRTSSNESGN